MGVRREIKAAKVVIMVIALIGAFAIYFAMRRGKEMARERNTLFYRFEMLPGPGAIPGFIAEAGGFLEVIE